MLNVLTVDLSKIPNEASIFEHYKGDRPSYCVMSGDTLNLIVNNINFQTSSSKNNYIHGIPIAICDNLKLGEVDIV